MIFKKEVIFGNCVNKVSKKGTNYKMVTLFDGDDTIQCMSDVLINSPIGKKFIAIFELNTKYNNLKVVGVDAD